MLFFALFFVLNHDVAIGEKGYSSRNSVLLNRLISDFSVDVLDPLFALESSVDMRDTHGHNYDCIQKNSEEDLLLEPLGERIAAFEGICARLSLGWWTYEWCHKDEVRQFHEEGQRQVDNWSLGTYVRSVDNTGDPDVAEIHYFEGGQRCDETGLGRNTQVMFRCCGEGGRGNSGRGYRKEAMTPRRSSSVAEFGDGTIGASGGSRTSLNMPMVKIQSVQEPVLCSYVISVCSPLACNSTVKATPSVTDLLQELPVCLYRHEGWWSYEFCYGKHVRQFHIEVAPGDQSVDEYGKQRSAKQDITDKFYLGIAGGEGVDVSTTSSFTTLDDASHSDGPGRFVHDRRLPTAGLGGLRAHGSQSYGKSAGMGVGPDGSHVFYVLEYRGGDECELTRTGRSTTVRLTCGPRNELLAVDEDRTCHYTLLVSTPSLCAHAEFLSEVSSAKNVHCSSVIGSSFPSPVSASLSPSDGNRIRKGVDKTGESPAPGVVEPGMTREQVVAVEVEVGGDASTVSAGSKQHRDNAAATIMCENFPWYVKGGEEHEYSVELEGTDSDR